MPTFTITPDGARCDTCRTVVPNHWKTRTGHRCRPYTTAPWLQAARDKQRKGQP